MTAAEPPLAGRSRPRLRQYVRPMRPVDEDWVCDCWQRRYGAPAESYVAAAAGDHGRVLGDVAMAGEQCAGFAIASVESLTHLDDLYGVDLRPYVDAAPVGLVYQVCVRSGFESDGHGTRLFRRACRRLAAHDADVAALVACSWLRRDAHDSSVILDRLGFERVFERDTYWGDARPDCPDCGATCRCDAAFYVRHVNGGAGER